MKNTKKRLSLFIGILMLLVAFSAMMFSSGCSGLGDFFDIIRCGNRPHLNEEIDCTESAPVIYGCFDSEELNEAISARYQPLTEAVSSINSNNEVVRLEHIAIVEKEYTAVETYAVGYGDEKALVYEFTITDGELYAYEMELPEFLCGGELLCDSYFRLMARDLAVEGVVLDESVLVQEMCGFFVDYYESLCEAEISTDIFRYEGLDELFMKAAVLGVYEDEYSFNQNDECYVFNVALSSRYLLENLYKNYCGNSSKVVTKAQLAELCNLFLGFYAPEEYSESFEAWQNAMLLFNLEGDDSAASRADAAQIFVEKYEMYFGEMDYSDDYYTDAWELDVLKAGYRSLLNDFPTFSCLSPECEIWFCELPELANHYADILSYDIISEHTTYSGRIADGKYLICTLGSIDRYLENYPKCEDPAVVVDNSGGRDFYFTQFGTGKYSYVNCMPTITAMAIKWYQPESKVKVSDIRKLFLPDYKDGWYAWQVMDSLYEYDIPFSAYNIEDYSYEGISSMIIEELDKGNIVLSQMSENVMGESGHCFVIYGYKKLGDSCVFLVHDPGIYSGYDCFGKCPGDSIEIDSAYACFIINRIAYNIISVGDN